MALSVVFRVTSSDYGTVTKTPQTAGPRLNITPVEEVIVSKLTGDTSGTVTLNNVLLPTSVVGMVLADSAGAQVSSLTLFAPTFAINSNGSITISGLGNWTRALLKVRGAKVK